MVATANQQHKNVLKSVEFIDIGLEFGVVVAMNQAQHKLTQNLHFKIGQKIFSSFSIQKL